jgi:dTDP-4-dehydrorhamnose 3,5-epimerase
VNEKKALSKVKEVYCSSIFKDKVKAWKKHYVVTQQLSVPLGLIKVVLFDDREESTTYKKINEVIIGNSNYVRLTIPPNIWYGFKSCFSSTSLLVNTPDGLHDPNEAEIMNVEQSLIPYSWE